MSIRKKYIYVADRIRANGQILAQHDGGRTADRYFYLHDRLGSVRQVINSSGSVVKYCTFEPFGRTIESGGTFDDPFGFTGQYLDPETGEYYLWARQYNPTIARFTARDPIFGDFKQPLTLDKYLYCINDPVNRTDLTGEWAAVIGGSLSGNLAPGLLLESLTKGFGIMGYSFGLSALVEAEVGFGGTVGSGVAFAHDPDKGLTKGYSLGWVNWAACGLAVTSGSGYSITAEFAFSPEAKRVRDLGGYFEEVGGSVAFEVPGRFRWLTRTFWNASVGVTASRSVDERGNPTGIHLYTVSPGTGLAGWEVHAYKGHTTAYEWVHN